MIRTKFVQIRGPIALPLVVLTITIMLPVVLLILTSFMAWGLVGRILLGRSSPGLSGNTLFTKLMAQAQGRSSSLETNSAPKPDIVVEGRKIDS